MIAVELDQVSVHTLEALVIVNGVKVVVVVVGRGSWEREVGELMG